MTLEMTLLKVHHSGASEARKLIPYIQNCDVFGPENPCATENESREIENYWEAALKLTRSAHRRFLDRIYSDTGTISPETAEYNRAQQEVLHRSQKPIYILERLSDEDSENGKLLRNLAKSAKFVASKSLVLGNVDDFVDKYFEGCRYELHQSDMRDANMASVMINLEDRIRRRYEKLRDKNHLVFAAALGACHKPETRVSVKSLTVVLSDTTEFSIYEDVNNAISEGKQPHECKKELLVKAIYELNLVNNWKLDMKMIKNYTFTELLEVINKRVKKF